MVAVMNTNSSNEVCVVFFEHLCLTLQGQHSHIWDISIKLAHFQLTCRLAKQLIASDYLLTKAHNHCEDRFTVGEGVRKRHPMAGQFLKGPELVDTVKYCLRPVDQSTAHLLQVAKHSDVTV